MVITDIKQNANDPNRYSIFIDKKFAFALSTDMLIETKLAKGDQLDTKRLDELKQSASSDKLYASALKYTTARLKTKWETETYLRKKSTSPALNSIILNKLIKLGVINDEEYVKAYIGDKQAYRPASRLKIEYALRKKHIDRDIITKVLGEVNYNERPALRELINKKRSYYKDDKKLIAYLVRQGFNYGDIKNELDG